MNAYSSESNLEQGSQVYGLVAISNNGQQLTVANLAQEITILIPLLEQDPLSDFTGKSAKFSLESSLTAPSSQSLVPSSILKRTPPMTENGVKVDVSLQPLKLMRLLAVLLFSARATISPTSASLWVESTVR